MSSKIGGILGPRRRARSYLKIKEECVGMML